MKTKLLLTSIICTIIFCISSCAKKDGIDIGDTEPPVIEFILDELKPDLNVSDNIPLVGVVFSDLGLKSIDLKIVRDNSTEDYKTITNFYDPTQYSIKELPLWEQDFRYLLVMATDRAGRVTEKQIKVTTTPYKAPPVITFELPEIVFDENLTTSVMPITKFKVEGSGTLKSVSVKIYNNKTGVRDAPMSNPVNTQSFTYDYNESITYGDGDVGLQVTAVDQYDKLKIETLPIKYTALPPPVVTWVSPSELDANVGQTIDVKLTITSASGITSVKVAKMRQNTELSSTLTSYSNNEKAIDFVKSVALEDNVSSLKITVTDRFNRTTVVQGITNVGFETRTITLGSDFYNRGIIEEPGIYPFYSIGLNKSMTIGEAYPQFKNVDMYVLFLTSTPAYTGDTGFRLMGPKNTVSLGSTEPYYQGGSYTWNNVNYTTPSMFPATNWANRNQTTMLKIAAVANSATGTVAANFDADNVTIADLKAYNAATVSGDRMPYLLEGDNFLLKLDAASAGVASIGATTGVTSKLCVAKVTKILAETRPVTTFTNPWPTAPVLKKIAKVTLKLKIPK